MVRPLLTILAALAAALLCRFLHLPAAWLVGPLIVAALCAVKGWVTLPLPTWGYILAQAIIGTALGAGFSPGTLGILPQHVGIFTFAVSFVLATGLGNGWLLSKFTHLDPQTAYLGTMPGGAGAMAAMSDSLGADTRLVTAIQYLRLLLILGALILMNLSLHRHPTTAFWPHGAPFDWSRFGLLVGIAAVGWLAGAKTRIPAGAFIVPTVAYFALSYAGLNPGIWPWPLLAAAYVFMGMHIGGRFHPSTLAAIRRVIVPVTATTLLLLGACFALALILAREMHLDLVSAYLASTPGGLDSVAAIASELKIDTTLVLAMHLVRLLCVLILGPWLVRVSAGMLRFGPLDRRSRR